MKAISVSIIFLMILDFIWIFLNKDLYAKVIKNIQNTKMSINIMGALVAYLLMIIGFVRFIVPNIPHKDMDFKNKLINAFKYGALFGFVVYGIYNATNIAIFKNYSISIAFIDTLWGSFAYFATTYIYISLHVRHS